jgi:hypothetical protein
MNDENQEFSYFFTQKLRLEDEIKILKVQLQEHLQNKIEIIKSLLMLKRTKKNIELEIKDIENNQNTLKSLESNFLYDETLAKILDDVQEIDEDTNKLKQHQLSKYLAQEKTWKDHLEQLETLYAVELDQWNHKKVEITEKILVNSLKHSEMIKEISAEKIKKLDLSKELDLARQKVKQLNASYDKLRVETKLKLFESHNKLNKEQESTIKITQDINELEYQLANK